MSSTIDEIRRLAAPMRVGDGSVGFPWDTDGLVVLAKTIQDNPIGDFFAVSVHCEDPDGNDPWEATLSVLFAPRVGESIEVWIDYDKVREVEPDFGYSGMSGGPEWLDVKDVVHCSYWPERVKIWISTDGHSDDDMRRIFDAIRRGDKP